MADNKLSVRTSKEPELKGLKFKNITKWHKTKENGQIKNFLRIFVCCALPAHF